MNRATWLLPTLGLILSACNEYELVDDKSLQGDGLGDGVPDIAVNPLAIDFGDVYVAGFDGDEEAPPAELTQVVTITNEGDADLHIESLTIPDAETAFAYGALSSVLVQPGGTAQFSVTFAPLNANPAIGSVLITNDDPDESIVEVILNGQGIAPMIDITPVEYDFGTLYVGCEGLQPITITNVGNADLEVLGFEYNTGSDEMLMDQQDALYGAIPWTLAPEETVDIYVSYNPMDLSDDVAYLIIESNDPYTPEVLAKQWGNGEIYGTNLDEYEQPIKGMTDIIFAVDRSCSMDADIMSVQDNFGVFVTTMASLDADYHIAATVEDNGCINGSDLYIDNTFSASEAITTISTMINLGGSYGMNTEMAFMLLESSLAEALSTGGCNAGLLRDKATLNLVGVSDEPEQSVSDYSYYVSLFRSLKEDPDDVVMHAIGGDYPSGCGDNDPYTGFYEATVATGGLFLSICATDWGAHLEDLAEGSAADLSSFELTDWPVPETISVRIDGTTTEAGWEYNPTDNAVDFDADHIPDGGAVIEIEYNLYGDCDS
jgi:hypothetical protein